ncbi:MAG: hypothetical protein ACTSWN_09680 [Promethearchaeota archaeon]
MVSHLICDNFKSNGTLADIFVGLFKSKGSPGGHQACKRKIEKFWLFMNYSFLLVVFFMLLLWINEGGLMDFQTPWNGSTIIMNDFGRFIIWFLVVYHIVIFIAFLISIDKK